MLRREFIGALLSGVGTAALLVTPRSTRGQSKSLRVARIAVILALGRVASSRRFLRFKERMSELGFVEGSSVVYDVRFADGVPERVPALARELLSERPDAFFLSGGAAAALDVRAITVTVPIVTINAGDPVGTGLAKTLARPGGNVTGVANFAVDLSTKLIELLRAVVPHMSHVGVLVSGPPRG
jgi:putative ABC transport system substrate-binding protein